MTFLLEIFKMLITNFLQMIQLFPCQRKQWIRLLEGHWRQSSKQTACSLMKKNQTSPLFFTNNPWYGWTNLGKVTVSILATRDIISSILNDPKTTILYIFISRFRQGSIFGPLLFMIFSRHLVRLGFTLLAPKVDLWSNI